MAEEPIFGEKLSKVTKNKASYGFDDKSESTSDSVSSDSDHPDRTVTGFQRYEDPEHDDLFEISRAEKAVDKFLNTDVDLSSESEELPRVFSQDYEAKKQEMLQMAFNQKESFKSKRRFHIPAIVAAALAVIIIATGLTGINADAMPEPIRILVMQVNTLFSSSSLDNGAFYGDNQTSDFPEEISTIYEPTIILDGYKVSDVTSRNKRRIVHYTSEDGNEYIFRQLTVDFWLNYNTEDIDYEVIEVDDQYPGITYIQNGQRYIQWQQAKYVFEMIGDVGNIELDRLAASIKAVEE